MKWWAFFGELQITLLMLECCKCSMILCHAVKASLFHKQYEVLLYGAHVAKGASNFSNQEVNTAIFTWIWQVKTFHHNDLLYSQVSTAWRRVFQCRMYSTQHSTRAVDLNVSALHLCTSIDTIDYVHGIGNTPTHSFENVLFQRGTL
jgi:hypothetical protein